MTKQLLAKSVVARYLDASVQIPFQIHVDPQDPEFSKYVDLFRPTWFFRSNKVEVPDTRIYGIVHFFDAKHGHLDWGNIVDVPITAQMLYNPRWWLFKRWTRLELSGVTNPLPRFCYTGWGTMKFWVHTKMLNCELSCTFKTYMVPPR